MPASTAKRRQQAAIGLGVFAIGALMAWGASGIPGEAGYAGIGPNFLPWVVSGALMLCGALLARQALSGGYQAMQEPSGSERGDWRALAWVSAGVLLNAALLTTIGFILSCALCFTLAVRGLRLSEGRAGGSALQAAQDLAVGISIAAPVFWMFTKVLAISLPGLTASGWI